MIRPGSISRLSSLSSQPISNPTGTISIRPATIAPDQHVESFWFTALGLRVPAVLVSPRLDPGVPSEVFDHTSLLRAASELWGIRPLGRRAAAANSPLAALSLRDTPRAAPAWLSSMAVSLFGFSQQLESRIADAVVQDRLARRAASATEAPDAAARLALDRLEAFLSASRAAA